MTTRGEQHSAAQQREANISHLVHIAKGAAEAGGNLGISDPAASRIAEAIYTEMERFPAFSPQRPLELKLADGRFVRVIYDPSMRVHDEYGDTWGPAGGYRIVDDQAPTIGPRTRLTRRDGSGTVE